MSILNYFPKGYEPSQIQSKVLLELEARWNSANVFVLNLDVASGKSWLSYTIGKWMEAKNKGARICTPTTVLVDQYSKDFPQVPVAKSAGHYTCKSGTTCGAMRKKCKQCPYKQALYEANKASTSFSTYHMNIVLRDFRAVSIFDEAHRLPGAIRDMSSKGFFLHKTGMPIECIGDFDACRDWLNCQPESYFEDLPARLSVSLKEFKDDLNDPNRPLNFYTWKEVSWANGGYAFGEKTKKGEPVLLPYVTVTPSEIYDKPPIFWQERQKLILMSATIGRPDLYELGLDQTRPVFIQGDSPIEADRQPIIKDYVGSINHSNESDLLDPIAKKLMYYLNNKPEKGVIHITYGLAKKLIPRIKHERLITHRAGELQPKLKEYFSSDNKVLLACGMYEGVSLDYDKARWQVVSKIMWPSLADPFQKHRSTDDPDYYAWSTLKNVIQTAGRVCRRPDDYGETYVLDKSFDKLLSYAHLVPRNFKRRII